jgi:NADH-quinone oxidoreductase subunit E
MELKYLETMTDAEKRRIIRACGGDTEHLLSILLELQSRSKYSYIDEPTANLVAEELGLTRSHVHDAVTFYELLNDRPSARYVIHVCTSVACHYSKRPRAVDLLREELGIEPGEITADGLFTIRYCSCVGACDVSPVIKINDTVYGKLTPDKLRRLIARLRAKQEG